MNQLDRRAVWLFFFNITLRNSIQLIFLVVFFGLWGELYFSSLVGIYNTNEDFPLGFLKWLWIMIPIFLVLAFVWAQLTYYFYRYELTEVGFRKELGVIRKKYVTIPYDRIQNVDIYRGILARLLGLSDLHIQTAGAGMIFGEGNLPGLSKEVAEQIRNELIQRARQSRTATTNQGL